MQRMPPLKEEVCVTRLGEAAGVIMWVTAAPGSEALSEAHGCGRQTHRAGALTPLPTIGAQAPGSQQKDGVGV